MRLRPKGPGTDLECVYTHMCVYIYICVYTHPRAPVS